MYYLADFARTTGAKDKQKRKSNLIRNLAIGAGVATTLGIGGKILLKGKNKVKTNNTSVISKNDVEKTQKLLTPQNKYDASDNLAKTLGYKNADEAAYNLNLRKQRRKSTRTNNTPTKDQRQTLTKNNAENYKMDLFIAKSKLETGKINNQDYEKILYNLKKKAVRNSETSKNLINDYYYNQNINRQEKIKNTFDIVNNRFSTNLFLVDF